MTYWQSPGIDLYCGDAEQVLRDMPANSVHCCITSPPYFGLRDYGHPGQIGLESTLEEYLSRLGAVFREALRVLREDGTLWLVVGDCFASDSKWGGSAASGKGSAGHRARSRRSTGLPDKSLVMLPFRLALALQDAGWLLRQSIVWAKPNAMPEPVRDRPSSSHEHVFLFSKSSEYFYDWWVARDGSPRRDLGPGGRNFGTVWPIPVEPYPDAHFATFPTQLVRRCLTAGVSPFGCCASCGAPLIRRIERVADGKGVRRKRGYPGRTCQSGGHAWSPVQYQQLGGQASCACGSESKPCTVLDPFVGSGTVPLVARDMGHRCIGIDISADYLGLAARRLAQLQLPVGGAA